MEKDTPEDFYQQIQEIKTQFEADISEDNYPTYYTRLTTIRGKIQAQINKLLTDKPVKSKQLLEYYQEIYNTSYLTNFCLVLGIGLIVWYIVKSTFNSATPSSANVFQPVASLPEPSLGNLSSTTPSVSASSSP